VTGRTIFLTYVFPPDEMPRAIQVGRLVRYSQLKDLHVVCATERAEGPNTHSVPWGQTARLRRSLRWKTIRSRHLVPDEFRPWVRDAARAARALKPRTVVTFGQPMSDHLAGLQLKRGAGMHWIAHFSDPWTANPFRTDGRFARWANRRLESAVLRGADALVFTSEETVDVVLSGSRAGLRAKTHVLPHAIEPGAYPDLPARDGSEPLVVRHLGAFYGARTAAPLLRALSTLAEGDPGVLAEVRVELWGNAATPVQETPEFRALPPGVVSVNGVVPYARSLELMRGADLLVVVDAPAEVSVFLPSKLIDYVGARRPLLALTPPGAASSLVQAAGGHVARPDDPRACADALRAALAVARSSRRHDWGDPAVAARYDAGLIARQMDELVRSVGSSPERDRW
jgi:glycosyltransferase involved in cell wall biosynthesis